MGRKQTADPAKKRSFAEGPGEHGRDGFDRVRNFQDREGIGRAVEDAHFRRAFTQTKSQVWPRHSVRMHGGDQQVDGAGAGLSQFERLAGICRREDEVISVFQNLLHGLAEGFQIFDDENDWMSGGLRLPSAHRRLNSPGELLECFPKLGEVYYGTVNNKTNL
jgi:hypothetical protein